MDDDIAVDVFQLLDLLEMSGTQPSQRVIFGSVMTAGELDPLRDTSSKWYVTYDEYPMAKYPPFVSGWAYGTTVAAARQLVHYSQSSPFFWIDDVFVTGLLANLSDTRHVNIRHKLTIYEDELKCCLRPDRNRTACHYWIAPVTHVQLLDHFYRHTVQCWLQRCPVDGPRPACILSDSGPSYQMDGPVIKGQAIAVLK